jgi:hypothetical protein
MAWLQRHAWWGLLVIAAVVTVSGVVDLASGVTWQAEDVTGRTIAQIGAESSAGSQLADFSVRTGGLYLIAIGVLGSAILLFAFRQDRAWAWWTMWTIPTMVIAGSFLYPNFPTPGPAITGAMVGVLAVAILLVSAPRFFKRPAF